MSCEERIGLMVDAEWTKRQRSKLNRFIKNANMATPHASIEGIEYHADRKLDKTELQRLGTCQYIDDHRHIILEGASGMAKHTLPVRLETLPAESLKP